MEIGKTLYVTNRDEWRAWLEEHHDTEPEIWLVLYNKASGKPSLPYDDAVEEALCFGWIDSINKKLGPDSRAQRYTPRRSKSPVSPLNKERIQKMIAAGRMTEAGLAAAGDISVDGFEVAADIIARLKAEPGAWEHFEAFPDGYKRIRIGFVEGGRNRPQVFEQRLAYFVRMTAQGKTFGTVVEP